MPPISTTPVPELSLTIHDLTHPGAHLFLDTVHPANCLREAILHTFSLLYLPDSAPNTVQTLTLVLRSMDGVAHTCSVDREHKEIHLSLDHITNSAARVGMEVRGVITHEVVHCFQYNGNGKCPNGLIEGIADYVRLRACLDPPHWKPTKGDKWDAGYETTAYFLDWLERRKSGTVRHLNDLMNDIDYNDNIFQVAAGDDVNSLWQSYLATLPIP